VNRVGLVVHPGREEAVEAAVELADWLRRRGLETTVAGEVDRVPADRRLPLQPDEEQAAGLDLVVAVGGDGTFLRGAHLAAMAGCPVLGVKAGRMGFLTEVEPEEAPALLERVLAGEARIDSRTAVEAESDGAEWAGRRWALNEFIVEKAARHRVITLAAFIDGDYVATVSGDGVIVATPTGSTAYSFSARGPIVSPAVEALVVTPIAAHMVFDRSFVLAPEEQVVLEVLGEEPGLLSGDGRDSLELPVGARVRIRVSDRPARLVRPTGAHGFHRLVREKFDLPGNHEPLDDDPSPPG
jgi:NAD+ kinase